VLKWEHSHSPILQNTNRFCYAKNFVNNGIAARLTACNDNRKLCCIVDGDLTRSAELLQRLLTHISRTGYDVVICIEKAKRNPFLKILLLQNIFIACLSYYFWSDICPKILATFSLISIEWLRFSMHARKRKILSVECAHGLDSSKKVVRNTKRWTSNGQKVIFHQKIFIWPINGTIYFSDFPVNLLPDLPFWLSVLSLT